MKKALLSLTLFSFLLAGCGSEKAEGNPKKQDQKTKREIKDSTEQDKPVEEVASFQEGPEATVEILKHIDEDKTGYKNIKVDLGMGYIITADSAWFTINDWLCRKYVLKKDDKLLYEFPHEEGDMRSMSVSNRKFEPSFPRVFKKGDHTVIMVERYLGESSGGIQTDAIVLINDRFEKYLKNIPNTGAYKYEATKEKAEEIYKSISK